MKPCYQRTPLKKLWLTAIFAVFCFLAHMCNWPYIFFLSTEVGKVSFAAKARHQICVVSAPAMFPRHCYKTPLRVSVVMRKKN